MLVAKVGSEAGKRPERPSTVVPVVALSWAIVAIHIVRVHLVWSSSIYVYAVCATNMVHNCIQAPEFLWGALTSKESAFIGHDVK